jgi:hypothetical protein
MGVVSAFAFLATCKALFPPSLFSAAFGAKTLEQVTITSLTGHRCVYRSAEVGVQTKPG